MNTKLKFIIIFSVVFFGGLCFAPKSAEAAFCSTANPQSPSTTATSGPFRIYTGGVSSDVTAILYPTWSDASGQDDIVWYPGVNDGNGAWHTDVMLQNHPGLGVVNVHIYIYSPGATFCGTANFTKSQAAGGSFDAGNCSIIGGWAWDPDYPNTAISVHIYNNGVYYSAITAGDFRSDLPGNKFHGFTIPTPGAFKDGANHSVTLYAIDLDGTGNPALGTSNIYCPPSATISVNPTSIAYNGTTTVTWSSTNTSSCSVTPGLVSGTSGSFNSGALTATRTYTVTCTGGAASAQATVTVGPAPPTCSSATPDGTAAYGNTTQRVYANNVAGATSVLFPTWSESGGSGDILWYSGANAGGGSWYVDVNLNSHPGYGVITTHVYMSNAPYYSNVWCDSASYTSYAPLAATISANPTSIGYGGSSTLSWSSTSASTCSVGKTSGPGPNPPGGTGGLSNGNWTPTGITGTTVYFISCNGVAGGNVGATATINVATNATAGSVDVANCTHIAGWAWDPDQPNTPIVVQIANNGVYYNSYNANGFRSDLPGNHAHAFDIPTPAAFKDGAHHSINVYGIDLNGDANSLITGSPKDVFCPPATVDLRANGSNGPIGVNYNTGATLSWTSNNTTNCSLYGNNNAFTGWTGTAQPNVPTGNMTVSITYRVDCLSGTGGPDVSDSVTININAQPNCTGGSPSVTWTIATTGTVVLTATGATNVDSVYFPTWSDAGGQDDMIWYAGTNAGGGTWTANANLASHPGLGAINVHIYPINANYGGSLGPCGFASFTRLNFGTINVNSNTPATWTVNCPLTSPACPTVNSGAGQTSGTYPSKPYSTWTITPADIPGYDWKVNACATNTPCAGTFSP